MLVPAEEKKPIPAKMGSIGDMGVVLPAAPKRSNVKQHLTWDINTRLTRSETSPLA
jgi:hypothetical protein